MKDRVKPPPIVVLPPMYEPDRIIANFLLGLGALYGVGGAFQLGIGRPYVDPNESIVQYNQRFPSKNGLHLVNTGNLNETPFSSGPLSHVRPYAFLVLGVLMILSGFVIYQNPKRGLALAIGAGILSCVGGGYAGLISGIAVFLYVSVRRMGKAGPKLI